METFKLIRKMIVWHLNWLTSGEKEHLLFPQGAQSPRAARACALVDGFGLGVLVDVGLLIEVVLGALTDPEDESSTV